MHKKTSALYGVSLMLAFAFLACALPGAGEDSPAAGGGPSGEAVEVGESGAPVDPSVPTNTDGAETIVIPGGTFWMGSNETEALADEDEMPRHEVTLGTFPIYTHEVTNAMYARCVEAGACAPVQILEGGPTAHYDDPAFAEHPVVGVDWNMADDYCTWAGGRLPTEAEWEYAARGAESLIYPWGTQEPACERVNMLGCLVPPDTAQVGSYLLGNSPFEVWDLSGNVWEWTHDWYDPDYYALSPSTSPLGPNLPGDLGNPQKVVRGGGLQSQPPAMRSAERVGARPRRAFDDVGFRCVANGAPDLPAEYATVPDGHEIVPPDPLDPGGELVEDPTETYYVIESICHMSPFARIALPHPSPAVVSADADGAELPCSEIGSDEYWCGPLPGAPGSVTTISFCLEDGACLNGTIAVRACEAQEGAAALDLSVSVSCPDERDDVTITVRSSPAITWEGAALLLEESAGHVMFPDSPSGGAETVYTTRWYPSPMHRLLLSGFDAEGHEYTETLDVDLPDDCAEEGSSEGDFTFAGLGCHDDSYIFFMVDTGLDWLVPGAPFMHSAWDGDTDYTCTIHPTIAGRLYCSGPRPEAPDTLQVCVLGGGTSSPTCATFPGWPAEEDTIPDCAPPSPDGFSCSNYLDQGLCVADLRCEWERPPCSPPGCSCLPRPTPPP